MAVSELKGTTIGGPLKVIRELQDSTREVLGIPLGPWSETDIAASQTDNAMLFGQLAEVVMQYGGWVLGMSVRFSANFTASPPTFTLQLNGADTAMVMTPAITTQIGNSTEIDDYADAIRFERGDILGVEFDTTAQALPDGSVDAELMLWLG